MKHWLVGLFMTFWFASLYAQSGMPPASDHKLEYILDRMEEQVNKTADFYWHQGMHLHLVRALFLMIEINPKNIETYSMLGWLLDGYGESRRGFAVYERGIALNPDEYELYYDAGFWHFQKRNYAKAAEYLEQAVKRKAPPVVWKLLAHSYSRLGKYEKALEVWEQVRKMTPDDGAVELNVRKIKEKMAGGGKP